MRGLRAVVLVLLCCYAVGCSKPASVGSADTSVLEEFDVGRDGRLLLVPVTFQARTYLFAVDTGSALTIFDESLRGELGDVRQKVTLRSGSGDAQVERFGCPDARVGRLKLQAGGDVACTDLEGLRRATGEEIFGILGMPFLRQFIMHVDSSAGKLRFLNAANGNLGNWGKRLPLHFTPDGRPTVDACACDSGAEPFVLDTGASAMTLKASLFDRLADQDQIELGLPSVSMTIGADTASRTGRVKSMALGTFKHGRLPCERDRASALGLAYLSRYVVTFDFPGKSLYLKSGPRFSVAPATATSGLVLVRIQGKTLVQSVNSGSPAAKTGIEPDDELVLIAGRRTDEIDMFAIGQILTSEAGKRVVVTLRRGEKEFPATLVLVDRYAASGK